MTPDDNEQTRVCSIVSLDIAQFSQQPSEVQFSWRIELSMLLDRCLEGVGPERKIAADTSNGAAFAFTASAADALQLIQRMLDELPKLKNFALRVGAHFGPLHIVQESSGRPGIAGEGVNAAQRAMRFAGANEILVSRAFQEEILRLAPDSTSMFAPYGKHPSKLGREHDLFRMGQQQTLAEPLPPAITPAPAEPPIPAEPALPAEACAPPASEVEDAGATSPADQPSNIGVKIAVGIFLLIAAVVWLWFAQGISEQSATEPDMAGTAAPDVAAPIDMHQIDESPMTLPPESTSASAPEQAPLTGAPPPANVPAVKETPQGKPAHDAAARCPNCSCTDLMTKMSLGSALNENERRYLAERCKK